MADEDKPKDLLTPEEAAARLKISRVTVGDWLRSGKLKGVKVGRLWRIRESDLETFLKEGEKKKVAGPWSRRGR